MIFYKIFYNRCNQKYDNKRWKNHTKRCKHCAKKARFLITNARCAIDGYWSGRRLRNRYVVGKIVFRNPFSTIDKLVFYHGNHGISSTESEGADLKKYAENAEKFFQFFHSHFPTIIHLSIPYLKYKKQ